MGIDDRESGTRLIANARESPTGETERLRRTLSSASRSLAIGSLDGAETALGNPVGLVVGAAGEIYVLDAMYNNVRVFDAAGRFLYSVGRRGAGPAEMQGPVGFGLSAAGEFVVAEPSGIKVLEIADGSATQKLSIPVGEIPSPTAVCVRGDRIYQRSASRVQEGLITQISTTGAVLRRFGSAYTYGSLLAQEDLSVGPVACLPDGTVAAAFTYLPIIRSYDSEGRERWTSRISEFEPMRFEERTRAGGQLVFVHVAAPGEMVLSLLPGSDTTLLVQVATLGEPDANGRQRIVRRRTFAVDSRSGRGSLVAEHLPHLLAAGPDWLWGFESDSIGVPRLVKFTLPPAEPD